MRTKPTPAVMRLKLYSVRLKAKRLEAENAELYAALKAAVDHFDAWAAIAARHCAANAEANLPWLVPARAAIAKAEGAE